MRGEVDLSEVPERLLRNLKKSSAEGPSPLNPDAVDPNEVEGWIIQCPKSVELGEILRGQKLHLNGVPTILSSSSTENGTNGNRRSSGESYEAVAITRSDREENAFLILPDGDEGRFRMTSVPVKGMITIHRHVQEVEAPTVTTRRKRSRKLPSGIKERHPVYGVDFSVPLSGKRQTISKVVEMESPSQSPSPSKSKKSKKRKREVKEEFFSSPEDNDSFKFSSKRRRF